MCFCQDVITELTESLMSKKQRICPKCKKAILKKNSAIEHYIEVAVVKFASSLIGGAVPAPDYYFKCPSCKSIFFLIDGKFVPVQISGGGK